MTQTVTNTSETPERSDLRSQFRRLLANTWSDTHVRQHAEGDTASVSKLHASLRDQMFLHALTTPEQHHGLGAGCVEAAIAAEELGAAMAPSRLLATTMVSRLLSTDRDAATAALLERITDDQSPVNFLWRGNDATWDVRRVDAAVIDAAVAAAGEVRGEFDFVPDFEASAPLLCPATNDGQIGIAVIQAGQTGVTTRAVRSLDPFRPLQHVSLTVREWQWLPVTDPMAFTEAIAAGAIVLAAEMVGAARSCLERMVTYSKQRQQFGKQIGTFQALKHRMVDVLVAWEAARALTYRAAASFDEAAKAGADLADCIASVRMAKAAASDALRVAAKECIHVHGATGITWENPIHFYLKRWASSARLFGSPDQLRVYVYENAVKA